MPAMPEGISSIVPQEESPEIPNDEYSNLFNEHADFINSTEEEFTQVLAPGLDIFFNAYGEKSLAEGLDAIMPIADELGVDRRNLLISAAFSGDESNKTKGHISLEDATNVSQTLISTKLDTNLLVDSAVSSIIPIQHSVQSLHRSSVVNPVASENLLKLFTADVGRREDIILEILKLRNFDGLNDEQKIVAELMLLSSTDDYNRPEDSIHAISMEFAHKEFVDMTTLLDPTNWDGHIKSKVDFLKRLKIAAVSSQN